MKKLQGSLLALFALTLAFGPLAYAEAQGKAFGHEKGAPGNSAFGRSHNPVFGNSVMWGGQSYANLEALIERLQKLLAELRAEKGKVKDNSKKAKKSKKNNKDQDVAAPGSLVGIVTEAATKVGTTSATLHATLHLKDEDHATVHFEYWARSTGPVTRTARLSFTEDGHASTSLSGLQKGTEYRFRAVARTTDGKRVYGKTLAFTTSADDQSLLPSVTTRDVRDVATSSARLRGEVNMNEYENGTVFFVYGENKAKVESVAQDFDTYAAITEDGLKLRKVLVDSDLDGEDTYARVVTGLASTTTYHVAIGVGYQEGGNDTIQLGQVRSFTTK